MCVWCCWRSILGRVRRNSNNSNNSNNLNKHRLRGLGLGSENEFARIYETLRENELIDVDLGS